MLKSRYRDPVPKPKPFDQQRDPQLKRCGALAPPSFWNPNNKRPRPYDMKWFKWSNQIGQGDQIK